MTRSPSTYAPRRAGHTLAAAIGLTAAYAVILWLVFATKAEAHEAGVDAGRTICLFAPGRGF
jgi:hypothetical protein